MQNDIQMSIFLLTNQKDFRKICMEFVKRGVYMSKYKILYNPQSNNRQGGTEAKELDTLLKGNELTYIDVLKEKDIKALITSLQDDEKLIVAGGDGTLNHFINDIDGIVN